MKIPTFDLRNSVALDQVTYLSGAQEHRHEVPKPGAQPHQQPQGPQEPRPEAQCAQWRHLCWAYCQDDSGGKGEGKEREGWAWTGLESGGVYVHSCALSLRASVKGARSLLSQTISDSMAQAVGE